MKIIGLLGGVASGKSLVAAELCALGAVVLDADRAGHEVLREPEVMAAARARWGGTIFTPEGQINRSALAAIVFARTPAGANDLAYLEQLTHPRIAERLRHQIAAYLAAGQPVVVLDAPVMLKAGWDSLCDVILFVDVPQNERLSRALGRGWTAADFAAREAAQEPVEEKRRHASVVVDNSGSREQTQQQVARVWTEILGNSQSIE